MHEAEADCVLVTVDDRLVGIFTDRDAVVKAAGMRLDAFKVRDFMTPDPVVLRHDDPIAIAIHKMAVGGFRHIPIIEDGSADRRRHRPRRLPSPRGDARLTTRVAVLADDLIWGTRLAGLVRGAGADSRRRSARWQRSRRRCPTSIGVVDRPDRPRLRRDRGGRGRASGRHARPRGRPARRRRAAASARWPPAPTLRAVPAPDRRRATSIETVDIARAPSGSRPT